MGIDATQRLIGALVAQSSVVDEVDNALSSSQVTGWQVLAAGVVLIVSYPVGHLVRGLATRAMRRVPDMPAVLVTDVGRFAKWSVWLLGLAIAIGLVTSFSVTAILIVAILVVAVLTLRPMLENMSAGLVLTLRPAFAVGDQIEVLDQEGVVLEIGSHSTVLKSIDGIRSHIPNVSMIGQKIDVYTAFDSRRSEFDLSLPSGTDVSSAIDLIRNAAASAEGVVADPAPTALASGFNEDAFIVTVYFWYPSKMQSDVTVAHAAIEAVKNALDKAGIQAGGPTTALDITSDTQTATPQPPTPDHTDTT